MKTDTFSEELAERISRGRTAGMRSATTNKMEDGTSEKTLKTKRYANYKKKLPHLKQATQDKGKVEKTSNLPITGGGDKKQVQRTTPSPEQVLTFITNTMTTLEEFKKHFVTQTHTNETR